MNARDAALGAMLAAIATASEARADDVPFDRTPVAQPDPVAKPDATVAASPKLTPVGYVEAYYQYNFNRPSNGITDFRAFDNRSNSFTLSNVALGLGWEAGEVTGRAVMQVGSTPSTYYGSEPRLGGGSAANASSGELWKYLQEAWVGYKAPIGRGILFQLGLCVSPIGPEVLPIKDNWNWSRSNLFFALPFYHAGLRVTYELSDRLTAQVAIFNGYNNIVDNNESKSVLGSLTYKIPDKVLVQVLYFGGVERTAGAPEGSYWRHDFDAFAQLDLSRRVSVIVHGNAGFEPNRFGTSTWYTGALYGRFKATEWLYVALRGDRFWEDPASNATGSASYLFWPVRWVSSGTATLDARPRDNISVRLEYRHDQADGEIYFRSNVVGNGSAAAPFMPNARSQDTVTLGATTWF